MNNSELSNSKGSDTLIVSFGGNALMFGGIQSFEFLNFLTKHFPDTDTLFYIDKKRINYHHGIEGISNTIPETVEYLKEKIKGYSKVIFLGVSSGGYAAILFGSLVCVDYVLAFIPQTILHQPDKIPEYRNLKGFINSVTEYYLYGDTSITYHLDPHHISHCENILSDNVFLTRLQKVCLRSLRDSGELKTILTDIVSKIPERKKRKNTQ
jgi:hypothetical protein